MELDSLANLFDIANQSLLEESVQIIDNSNLIKEELFNLLTEKWERVCCFGSAERLIEIFGDYEEKSWVKKRSKLGRSADVWLTEMGEYSNYFLPSNQREIRNVKNKT